MKYIYWLIVLFVSINVNAQIYNYKSLPARRAVYAEFFGASMIVGVNYDSRFTDDSRLGYRVGLAFMPNEELGGINIPLEINYLVGRRETRNKLDLGVGVNLPCTKEGEFGTFAFLNIGYRFQPRNGVLFRIGLSPKFPFGSEESSDMADWADLAFWATSFIPYLSLGYAF